MSINLIISKWSRRTCIRSLTRVSSVLALDLEKGRLFSALCFRCGGRAGVRRWVLHRNAQKPFFDFWHISKQQKPRLCIGRLTSWRVQWNWWKFGKRAHVAPWGRKGSVVCLMFLCVFVESVFLFRYNKTALQPRSRAAKSGLELWNEAPGALHGTRLRPPFKL